MSEVVAATLMLVTWLVVLSLRMVDAANARRVDAAAVVDRERLQVHALEWARRVGVDADRVPRHRDALVCVGPVLVARRLYETPTGRRVLNRRGTDVRMAWPQVVWVGRDRPDVLVREWMAS